MEVFVQCTQVRSASVTTNISNLVTHEYHDLKGWLFLVFAYITLPKFSQKVNPESCCVRGGEIKRNQEEVSDKSGRKRGERDG